MQRIKAQMSHMALFGLATYEVPYHEYGYCCQSQGNEEECVKMNSAFVLARRVRDNFADLLRTKADLVSSVSWWSEDQLLAEGLISP